MMGVEVEAILRSVWNEAAKWGSGRSGGRGIIWRMTFCFGRARVEMSALTKYIDLQVLVITQDGRTILVRSPQREPAHSR